jgi:hypothetical protein
VISFARSQSTQALAALLTAIPAFLVAAPAQTRTEANVPVELSFKAGKPHTDPFNTVVLDVIFTDPKGVARKVPAFWAGGNQWKVRYSSRERGSHHWKSDCNDAADSGLHHVEGSLEITPFTGTNPLFRHGPLEVASDKRHLQHADGTPFFWLGDTWWMGLCSRLAWPDDFQKLAADRKEKGFTVIQIVAGLYPDMHPFDPRGANEAGYPWETNYTSIRPEYFDAADQRLRYLIDEGFTPCIVGAWGYFIPWMGVDKMKAHWRYLIARYGAWPVVWCAAGEANLPWYLAKGFPYDARKQVHSWTEVMRYIRSTDPFHHPLTIHPTGIGRLSARNATDDASLLDFDMLQTPHGQREAVAPTVRTMRESYPDKPPMPVINSEASYEMLLDKIPAQWPRAMFWVCMMNGAAGHTYGANGIWQVNRVGKPHGASPNGTGNGYGVITWEEAMRLPGSQQVSLGKRFLESLPWTELKPMSNTASWADALGPSSLGSWIWFPEGDPKKDAPIDSRFFRTSFVLSSSPIRTGSLRIAADDRFTAWLNGEQIASGANWHMPARVDVVSHLRRGTNVLAVRAENAKAPVSQNPAGLTAALRIELQDGTKLAVRTTRSWRVSRTESANWQSASFDASSWSNAVVIAKFGEPPWGNIGSEDPLLGPQVCGIGDRLRVAYLLDARPILLRNLKPQTGYNVAGFDPVAGKRTGPASVLSTAGGELRIDSPPTKEDWVYLIEMNSR